MNWISDHLTQLTGVAVVAIILSVGRAKILPGTRQNAAVMWVAFAVTVLCGLVLGWSLVGFMGWATSLRGGAGWLGQLGAIVALAAGWWGVRLLAAMVRDIADGRPDDDARKAALWVPTVLPAGWSAVWGVVTHPHGLGTGITAAVMGAITIVSVHRVVADAMRAKKARTAWLWFAAGACLLGGLVATPLVLYLDGIAAGLLSHNAMVSVRLLAGAVGLALLVAAVRDITDRVPDAAVRAFLAYGLPLVIAFGAVTIAALTGDASNGAQLLAGSIR